jgi:hypothetical protein
MKYTLSEHARSKIIKRKLDVEMIEQVLQEPGQIIEEDDLTVYQSIFKIDQKNYLCRVFVNTDKQPNLIITAYITSKIDKYWS